MKFIHVSDLHLGKRVHEYSMIDDQWHILSEIVRITAESCADAVFIAGDVYDRSVPNVEAVELFDEFLTRLAGDGRAVFVIGGNHDSGERLQFGKKLMSSRRVYFAGAYDGSLPCERIQDAYGEVNVYMLPFVRPAVVNSLLGTQTSSYDECVRAAIDAAKTDKTARNVLIAHQFVTAAGISPDRSDSETLSLGGVDNVDVSAFDAFDYVALGHIHAPQRIGREEVRYCGSPIAYSFSECRRAKSVVVGEICGKGEVDFKLVPLVPLHAMGEVKCELGELKDFLSVYPADSYMHITLTDREKIINAIEKVREVYPNVMKLDFDNGLREKELTETSERLRQQTTEELFALFFDEQNGTPMTERQAELLRCFTEDKQ